MEYFWIHGWRRIWYVNHNRWTKTVCMWERREIKSVYNQYTNQYIYYSVYYQYTSQYTCFVYYIQLVYYSVYYSVRSHTYFPLFPLKLISVSSFNSICPWDNIYKAPPAVPRASLLLNSKRPDTLILAPTTWYKGMFPW